jgi:uncharacterized membrane protein
MSTPSVWRFDTPDGAGNAVSTLGDLSQQKLITVHDAATGSWQPGAKKPETRQLQDLTGARALGGASCGMLFGLLFLVPLLGAAAGVLTGRLTDVGIRDAFIVRVGGDHPRRVRAVRGHLRRRARPVREAFAGERAELLFTSPSPGAGGHAAW